MSTLYNLYYTKYICSLSYFQTLFRIFLFLNYFFSFKSQSITPSYSASPYKGVLLNALLNLIMPGFFPTFYDFINLHYSENNFAFMYFNGNDCKSNPRLCSECNDSDSVNRIYHYSAIYYHFLATLTEWKSPTSPIISEKQNVAQYPYIVVLTLTLRLALTLTLTFRKIYPTFPESTKIWKSPKRPIITNGRYYQTLFTIFEQEPV